MILLTEMRIDSISSPRTGTYLTFGHLLLSYSLSNPLEKRNHRHSTLRA
jgi:hypothetical protein